MEAAEIVIQICLDDVSFPANPPPIQVKTNMFGKFL